MFNGKQIIFSLTGGTGLLSARLLSAYRAGERYKPQRLDQCSRATSWKQFEMQQEFNADCMRYFLGDIRDRDLHREAP